MSVKVIDFHAVWCGPCKTMAPVFENMKKKYGDKAEFIKVDIDEDQDMAAEFNIASVPTFVIVKDGLTIAEIVGTAKPLEFEKFIIDNIG